MDNINFLISALVAIQNFCKDIHYNAKGEAFYSKHLLVDRIQENIFEYIDQLKEVFFLPAEKEPLPSKIYLTKAIELLPEIQPDDSANFESLRSLIIQALRRIEEGKSLTQGESNLLGAIAQDLQTSLGLIQRQVKNGD